MKAVKIAVKAASKAAAEAVGLPTPPKQPKAVKKKKEVGLLFWVMEFNIIIFKKRNAVLSIF